MSLHVDHVNFFPAEFLIEEILEAFCKTLKLCASWFGPVKANNITILK